VWEAIRAYLAAAYDGAAAPALVDDRLASLRRAEGDAFYASEAWERGDDRYALRLGNRFYPHMKMALLAVPGARALFLADTHDRHFRELVQTQDPRFAELMARNERIARAVEEAWAAAGLLTPRAYLQEQLATWRAART
jgi:hypothetical protein